MAAPILDSKWFETLLQHFIFIFSTAIVGGVVGIIAGLSGAKGDSLSALLPALLTVFATGAGIRALRFENASSRIFVALYAALFMISVLSGLFVGTDYWERYSDAKRYEELQGRSLIIEVCSQLETHHNENRFGDGLPPLSPEQICPSLGPSRPSGLK